MQLAHNIKNFPSDDALRIALKSYHHLRVNTREGLHIIPIEDIFYIQSYSNYSMFYLKGGMKITASKTLKSIERKLKGHPFSRCHQSYLVNLKEIRLLEPLTLKLSNRVSIPVSKSRQKSIMNDLATMTLSI